MHYNRKAPFVYKSRYELHDFNVPLKVMDWVDSNLGRKERDCKSLVLWGPTRVGKTQLARVFGDHWYMNVDWDVMQVRSEALYGVIDDFDVLCLSTGRHF